MDSDGCARRFGWLLAVVMLVSCAVGMLFCLVQCQDAWDQINNPYPGEPGPDW